jgi:hypothetical protein
MNINELNKPLTFFHDAGHGWLKVPKSWIKWLKIEVSRYSYHDNNFVEYLKSI